MSRIVRVKAFTVLQPWASLLALGAAGPMRFLTREFRTSYQGPFAIHASRRVNGYLGRDREWLLAVAHGFGLKSRESLEGLLAHMRDLPYGEIVGLGNLHACTEVLDETWRQLPVVERILGDWKPGNYAYELRDVQPLESPLPARGWRGLWEWDAPAELVDRLASPSAVQVAS